MRRTVRFGLLGLLASLAAGAPAEPWVLPQGVNGVDNRVWVNGAEPPWQAIGRIHKAGRGFCTGVLIAPSQVLTAAHCIWNKATGKPIPGEYLFYVAGYHKETYLAYSNVRRLHHDPSYRQQATLELAMVERDWALLELAQPIHTVPPMPLRRLSAAELAQLGRDRFFLQAGFSKDRPYILTVDHVCQVQGKAPGHELTVHDCDAIQGDSGSPLMVQEGEGLAIVALHSATYRQQGQGPLGLAVPTAVIPAELVRQAQANAGILP